MIEGGLQKEGVELVARKPEIDKAANVRQPKPQSGVTHVIVIAITGQILYRIFTVD